MPKSILEQNPVAIIGQAAIFARSANLQEYWNNILDEVDCITDVPPSRWDPEDYYHPDPEMPDKTYCKRGGFIPDIDFNPLEFGLPPNLLEVTDTSQLLGLVVARDAMEDAGYGMEREFDRTRTGVILGVAGGQKLITDLSARLQYPIWDRVLQSSGVSQKDAEIIIEKIKLAYAPWNENSFPGLLGNVIAGRIANRLDLGGLNSVVDAACASSLAAVRMAVSELVEGRADMMITGGVDTDNSPFTYLCFSKTPAFSPSQEIRPFDINSDGMLIGEGLGMVVLKRLADARRDGDQIYAVIRGIGSSSDGKYKSIYAPRPSGQSLAIERAYQEAGFSPDEIDLVEAHGTGTKAGDPAEFSGLKEAFGTPNGRTQRIAIGSVKSQIGHTKAAAGAAGLIKTALALHQKVLPPTINISAPSPALDIENSHFYVNNKTRPWFKPPNGKTRKAAVSAFGFGGTNFHLVLEESPEPEPNEMRLRTVSSSILLSRPSTQELIQLLEDLTPGPDQQTALSSWEKIQHTSYQNQPPADHPRLGFVARSAEEAFQHLTTSLQLLKKNPAAESWEHPRGIYFRQAALPADQKMTAVFPGQGSQYLNMIKDAVVNFPLLRQGFEDMDSLFLEDDLTPLTEITFPIPAFREQTLHAQQENLRETEYAQAGIGVVSYGMFKLLARAGFQPDFTAGHSFGELTALWAGGVLSDQSFLRLVKARGAAMRPPERDDYQAGMMAAVMGSQQEIKKAIEAVPDVVIANQNSPTQVVIAGPSKAVQEAEELLTQQDIKVTPLPVSAAFHTPLVEHASAPFAASVQQETFQKGEIPVYSNTTGDPYPSDPDQAREILAHHILHPVVFQTQIENIYQAGGRIFVEIGPRQILSRLISDILGDRPHEMVALNPSRDKSSDHQLREGALKLRVLGVELAEIDPYQI